ncbi:MAG: type IIL restriction-modification enzyme MmeI, partial [Parabacteroides sp.]|nr:type IIL restriction-modification enzyme MmeI [Parabacteroides sp.]
AGVTCVIVGVSGTSNNRFLLFDNSKCHQVDNISPLLMNGPTVFVESQNTPLCKVPQMNFGNMPADGGKLILSEEEHKYLISQDNRIQSYCLPLIGAEDFIHGKRRWCLWLLGQKEEQFSLIPEIKRRVAEVKAIRQSSSRPQLANTPHLFAQITQPLGTSFIVIPSTSSENRKYIPMGYMDKNNIVANSCMVVATEDMSLFGILTSAMHMVWVKTVGGRLKTDYRYSAQLCYNTFPFPKISDSKKQEIADAAEEVLVTREYHLGKTLAELYDPDRMPQDLREAHERLDNLVESCYPGYPFANDEARLECLFTMYEQMTASKH